MQKIIKIKDKNLWNDFVLSQGGDFLQSWEWKEFQEALGRKVFLLGITENLLKADIKKEVEGDRINSTIVENASSLTKKESHLKVGATNESTIAGVDIKKEVEGDRINSTIVENASSLTKEALIAGTLVVKYPLPFGKSYLYCGRGPVMEIKSQKLKIKSLEEIYKLFFDEIKKIAKNENAVFFRIDPPVTKYEVRSTKYGFLDNFKKIKDISSAVAQPGLVWQLDISKSEEELLNQMKPKTRYNIKLSQRKGVKVRNTKKYENTKKDFEIFWYLMQETAKRDRFKLHSKIHYKKLLEISNNQSSVVPALRDQSLVVLFIAEHQGEPLAAAIILFFGNQATYLHGASSDQKRNLMASYLIQWEAIKEAKKRGCAIYDFGGVTRMNMRIFAESTRIGKRIFANEFAKKKMSNVKCQIACPGAKAIGSNVKCHPWEGITKFKMGFGGKEVEYLGTYDLIFQPIWYRVYGLVRVIRRLIGSRVRI